MRPYRFARIVVIPALVLPVVLSTVAPSGTAWAKGPKSKTAKCKQLSGIAGAELPGMAGGNWSISQCTAPTSTGTMSTKMSTAFPTAAGSYSVVITWDQALTAEHLGGPAGTTTFSYTASQLLGHKNKCGASSTEWELVGSVTSDTAKPGVKGKLKLFACVSKSGGVLTQKKQIRI